MLRKASKKNFQDGETGPYAAEFGFSNKENFRVLRAVSGKW